MHDREILETFRDLLKLFDTFKPQKLIEFRVFYGKYVKKGTIWYC